MTQDIKFHTSLGQAVYDSIFLPAKVDISTNFLPRRMAFAYELGDEEWDGSGIPTTLRRSREDCPKVRSARPACQTMYMLAAWSHVAQLNCTCCFQCDVHSDSELKLLVTHGSPGFAGLISWLIRSSFT